MPPRDRFSDPHASRRLRWHSDGGHCRTPGSRQGAAAHHYRDISDVQLISINKVSKAETIRFCEILYKAIIKIMMLKRNHHPRHSIDSQFFELVEQLHF